MNLTPHQFDYLRQAEFLSASLVEVVQTAKLTDFRHRLVLSHDLAEEFRDAFTLRMVKVGFDSDYEPNAEGQLLEILIDLFFDQT